MSDWRPIETAPAAKLEDGDTPPRLLVWVPDDSLPNGGMVDFGYAWIGHLTGKFKPRASSYGGPNPRLPTHWMPLPEPPEEP